MRIIILSDLHILPNSDVNSTPWVNNFCNFLKNGKYHSETLIFVLGDIIDNDGKSGNMAFRAASRIFTYIESELSSVNYKIAFIPGNHDYCNGSLNAFEQFCRKHQTAAANPFLFSGRTAYHFTEGDMNFILTDSIREANYSIAGGLDLDSIYACVLADKENILLMHHSPIFEDTGDHTGIVMQPDAMAFLKQNNIKFVFHGHVHATRNFDINGDCKLFGTGSVGVENPGIDVSNWLWRGGFAGYVRYCLYPVSHIGYDSGEQIERIQYEEPDNYLARYVLPRDIAAGDEIAKYFALDKKTTLFDACMKERLVLFIADAGLGKTVEMRHLAYSVSVNNPYMRPVFLPLNLYSRESIEDYLHVWASDYRTLDPNQFILIMDGYDELTDPEIFKKALFRYILDNSETHICISMRSNFLASNSSVFKSFSLYQLLELEKADIDSELQKCHVDTQAFYEECRRKDLLKLLRNLFYLSKIIEIYRSDKSLTNQAELIARFIDIQSEKDMEKFEYAKPIEDSRYEALRALTRFAYEMQLLDCVSCDEETYEYIIEKRGQTIFKV